MPIKELQEQWKAITGYEGKYEVSDFGNARAINAKCHGASTIILAPILRRGYLAVRLFKDSRQKQFTIHRLVLLAFRGEDPARKYGNHIDGNKFNNRLDNLEWVTWRGNYEHAVRTGLRQSMHDLQKLGTSPRGSKSGMAKLTEADIPEIRQLLAEGVTPGRIAQRKGVSRGTIRAIDDGITWTHVP